VNILWPLIISALWVLLNGYQLSGPAASSDVPLQSVTFYQQHPLDAELVSRLCVERDRKKQSVLSNSAYENWHGSEDWRRCANPLFVTKAHEPGSRLYHEAGASNTGKL